MEIKYNNKSYELGELHEIKKNLTYNMIVIFERIEEENPTTKERESRSYKFINYFWGANDTQQNILSIAIDYIKEYERKETKHNEKNL